MATIKLTSKKLGDHNVYIDDVDYNRVMQFKWSLWKNKNGNIYAVRRNHVLSEPTRVYLHRFILNVTDSKIIVDHKNHNGLDCSRNNIRLSNKSTNAQNSLKQKTESSSKYKGVSWCNSKSRWRAQICVNRRPINLGLFRSEEEAAYAYDKAAEEHFGDFALINFPLFQFPTALRQRGI